MGINSRLITSVMLGIVIAIPVWSARINSSLSQTKENLASIEKKIQIMQKRLLQVQNKQVVLKQEITNIEQHIAAIQPTLNATQQQYQEKKAQITALEAEQIHLNQTYQQRQKSLEKLAVTRYKMTDKKVMLSFIQHPKTTDSKRLFSYYHYLLKANQQLINDLKKTQQAIHEKKEKLNAEFHALTNLRNKLDHEKEKLFANQKYHSLLMKTLQEEMIQTQKNIAEFRQSQIHLTHLMTTLVQQSVLQTKHPLSQMRHQLIRPVATTTHERNMNQGVLFSSEETTPVQAVYPGKVVFSDWLNAYGLLVIVDHGWGFMTLYANNQAIYKHKGDTVNQGEQIASVGHSGAFRQNGLYFEIRHRGKAVPPLQWLK